MTINRISHLKSSQSNLEAKIVSESRNKSDVGRGMVAND